MRFLALDWRGKTFIYFWILRKKAIFLKIGR